MLKILERKLALQLLVFYGLFVIPLLLGGAELYFFQYNALQQNAQQADLGVAQAIAQNVEMQMQGAEAENINLAQLTTRLLAVQRQLAANGEVRIWVVDSSGNVLADTVGVPPHSKLLQRIPGLRIALQGKTGNLVAQDQQRDWLYSYVPVSGTSWAVAVGRPTDATFAAVISFQHSLIIALIMLLVGASVFWFVMHGWVVAPLGRLAQAAGMMKPDQTVKVTDSKQLAREKNRQDEIGRLVNAFSTMEEEIHTLFRKSDEQSYSRLQTLDAILRSMDEGVILENPEGQIIYANHSFTRFAGISPREFLPDSFQESHLPERMEDLMEAPEAYHEAVRGAECGDGPQVIQFQVRGYYNQFGQLVPSRRQIRMSLFQVHDMANQLIGRGKIFNDVTQQSEAEQVKKNLLAIVSHELRTPLTAIKGYATSLLETDVELDAPTQRDFLQGIVEEEDRMAELVTSLLEMSQLEAGTLKLAPSHCRLDTLIERAVESAKSERLRIHTSLPAELPVLYIDRRRMEMVLRNLFENAQRYAGDTSGGAEVEITTRYAQEREDEGIYLSIADNGPGLPGDLTERIFDRFYQADSGRVRSSSGVGLGLAICRGFVEAHGGRIWAENRTDTGSGAIFHLWLPARLLYVPGSQLNPFELGKAL
jgi:signal transduction histidine kinase/HAMP domain-containing protein